jgi:hypothetical protein
MKKQRESSVTKKCRLLCPHGCGVQQVKATGEPIVLECGHERGELLPLKPGHISIEHLRQKIGANLFPAVLPREITDNADTADVEINEKEIAGCLEAFTECEDGKIIT